MIDERRIDPNDDWYNDDDYYERIMTLTGIGKKPIIMAAIVMIETIEIMVMTIVTGTTLIMMMIAIMMIAVMIITIAGQ